MRQTRREFLATAGAVSAACVLPEVCHAGEKPSAKKSHIVTLSFDDGFKRSSIKTAEIYEKHKLSACINVVASAHMKDFRPPDYADVPRADFGLWNDLKARGQSHAARLQTRQQAESTVRRGETPDPRCFDVFDKELKGFDRKQAVFNFPYNASTPELEKWLPTQVRAFRTGGGAINPLPYKGQTKLTCTSFGPGNCEAAIDREVERLLAKDSGWLIFNTHGLDDEGWGPIRAVYLERLLERLLIIESVEILPAGMALAKYTR